MFQTGSAYYDICKNTLWSNSQFINRLSKPIDYLSRKGLLSIDGVISTIFDNANDNDISIVDY